MNFFKHISKFLFVLFFFNAAMVDYSYAMERDYYHDLNPTDGDDAFVRPSYDIPDDNSGDDSEESDDQAVVQFLSHGVNGQIGVNIENKKKKKDKDKETSCWSCFSHPFAECGKSVPGAWSKFKNWVAGTCTSLCSMTAVGTTLLATVLGGIPFGYCHLRKNCSDYAFNAALGVLTVFGAAAIGSGAFACICNKYKKKKKDVEKLTKSIDGYAKAQAQHNKQVVKLLVQRRGR